MACSRGSSSMMSLMSALKRTSVDQRHALDVGLALAEWEIETAVLLEGLLQFRQYEQAFFDFAINVAVIGERDSARLPVARHDAAPNVQETELERKHHTESHTIAN